MLGLLTMTCDVPQEFDAIKAGDMKTSGEHSGHHCCRNLSEFASEFLCYTILTKRSSFNYPTMCYFIIQPQHTSSVTFLFNTLRTGDANLHSLRFCVTTVKDG
jgi:hypothetical protein